MPFPTRLEPRTFPLFLAALATVALVSGCSDEKKTATGNTVEMRDMEVVDGTVNDDMTDLDAVRDNGVGTNAMATGNAATPDRAPKAPGRAKADEAPEDAEAVAAE